MFGDILKRFHDSISPESIQVARDALEEALPVLTKMDVPVTELARLCYDDLIKSTEIEQPFGLFSSIFSAFLGALGQHKKNYTKYARLIQQLRDQDVREGEVMWRFLVFFMEYVIFHI